jgi:predicted component of type VI protein secretion system
MDEHKTVSVSRTYVPNEYVVWLSPQDREQFDPVEASLIDELSGYLLEHARRERLALLSRPQIEFRTDERLSLGEFGIQTRVVRPADESAGGGEQAVQADHGNTMIYSTAGRIREPLEESGRKLPPTRALLLAEGRRHVIPAAGATIGRSRDCDVVLADANVSRRHAQVLPAAAGTWTIADLGSTNGVLLNGRRISGAAQLTPGDRIALGTAEIAFELE